MPYSITTYSGTPLATVQDATINSTSTALTLIGRDYAGYGAFLNENFIYLLENFAGNTWIKVPEVRDFIFFAFYLNLTTY
jgi:hypothetical protein